MAFLSAISILVADYDEAISWYRSKLGFELIVDTPMGGEKRWVVVAPSADAQTRIILAKASGPEQTALIGRQMGGRVGFFLQTDSFDEAYANMVEADVVFREDPRNEVYGKVVVFEDCYGNGWDLIEPAD
ncbi:VOC family protein [Aquidulcibacter sp.]|uniref:VOC family protein n=1 Tax=Aquidulcibacter sp. TaxID=2052990 RepID=UPI003BA43171